MSRIVPQKLDKLGSVKNIMSDITLKKEKFSIKKFVQKCKEKSKISVHFSFLVLMLVGSFLGLFKILFFYFLWLCLHEMVHAFVAKKLGYGLSKISLQVGGAVLDAEQDEFSFKDEILIAISAPLFNLLVGFLIVSVWWIWPESYNFLQDQAVINFAIFGFNILPIFPLDGGRVLLGFLSRKFERKNAVKICKTISVFFSLVLFALFVVSLFISPVFSLGVASLNLLLSVFTENKNANYKRILYASRKLEKCKKGGIAGQTIYVHKNMSALEMFRLVDGRHITTFALVDDNMKIVKTISEFEVVSLLENKKTDF